MWLEFKNQSQIQIADFSVFSKVLVNGIFHSDEHCIH